MDGLKQKLMSRKLWVALVGIGVGIAAELGVEQSVAQEIGGLVLVALSVLAYVLGEAWTDTAHLPDTVANTEDDSTKVTETASAE
jgi:hypothetical protein